VTNVVSIDSVRTRPGSLVLCKCGCGQPVNVVKGKPNTFVKDHHGVYYKRIRENRDEAKVKLREARSKATQEYLNTLGPDAAWMRLNPTQAQKDYLESFNVPDAEIKLMNRGMAYKRIGSILQQQKAGTGNILRSNLFTPAGGEVTL